MTKPIDYTRALTELADEYAQHAPRSSALHARASQHLVDGGSHAIRLIQPFPPRVVRAQGAYFTDEDGHRVLDFWQGHLANLLGHNPVVVTSALAHAFNQGSGLQTGFADRLQVETAEILCRQTGSERVRFTTSGSLATMYAIMLARAFTGRDLVIKVGGGWHGAQPWGLKGVHYHDGFQQVEGTGVPAAVAEKVAITRFNDPEMLCDQLKQVGDRTACLIMEPFLGAGGLIAADPEYLRTAREWTRRYGAALILDEVVSGFRFRAGDVAALYGVQPDLSAFGKIIGGGMPVAAVAGRAEIMALAGRGDGNHVPFSGGTYSAHPASMLAAKTMLTYLVENEQAVYPKLAALGERMRQAFERGFGQEGWCARCTGGGNDVLPGSSMAAIHFPYREDVLLDKPDVAYNPAVCDVALASQVLELALLLQDVHLIHGHGAASAAHTESDMDTLEEACRITARRLKQYL